MPKRRRGPRAKPLDALKGKPELRNTADKLAAKGAFERIKEAYTHRQLRTKPGAEGKVAWKDTWPGSRLHFDPNFSIEATQPIRPGQLVDNPVIVTPRGEILDGYHRVGGVLSYVTGDRSGSWDEWPAGVEARIPVIVVRGQGLQDSVASSDPQAIARVRALAANRDP